MNLESLKISVDTLKNFNVDYSSESFQYKLSYECLMCFYHEFRICYDDVINNLYDMTDYLYGIISLTEFKGNETEHSIKLFSHVYLNNVVDKRLEFFNNFFNNAKFHVLYLNENKKTIDNIDCNIECNFECISKIKLDFLELKKIKTQLINFSNYFVQKITSNLEYFKDYENLVNSCGNFDKNKYENINYLYS